MTVLKSVLDILRRLHADAESQIDVLESQRFKVLAVAPDGAAGTDCTSVQLALLRSALTELHTAIRLTELQLAGHQLESRAEDEQRNRLKSVRAGRGI